MKLSTANVNVTYLSGELDLSTVGQRWGDALRRRYPSAKHIMQAFGATEGAVRGWLAGQAPQQRHLIKTINLHGYAILREVYVASPGKAALAAKQRLAAIRALCDQLEALE